MAQEDKNPDLDADKKAAEASEQEKRFAEIANRAAADHAKRFQAKFDKQNETHAAQLAAAQARIEELEGKAKTDPARPAGAPAEDVVAARLKEMEARDAARERERAKEKADYEAKQAAALSAEERAATVEALKEIGVTGAPAQAAHLLLKAEGRLGRDENGQVVFLEPKEGYTDKLAVLDGIKRWSESDAGKAFLPPKGVGGSGNKGGGPGPRKTGAVQTRAERVAEARAALAATFMGHGDNER